MSLTSSSFQGRPVSGLFLMTCPGWVIVETLPVVRTVEDFILRLLVACGREGR